MSNKLNCKYIFPVSLLLYIILVGLTAPINTDGAWLMRRHNQHIISGNWLSPMWEYPTFFMTKVTAKFHLLFSSAPVYNYILFRIPSLLCIIVASFFIYQFGKSYYKKEQMGILATLLYVFFATVYPSTGVVFRGDFFYSAVSIMLYSGLYLAFFAVSPKHLAYALFPILLTPVAFSLHPVGLILYLSVMFFLLRHPLSLKKKIALGVVYSIYYGGVSYFLAFYPQSIFDFISFTKKFTTTRPPFYMEYLRYVSLIIAGKEQAIVVLLSFAGLGSYFFSKIIIKKDLMWRNYLIIMFSISLLFFIVMPTRGLSYFSVVYFFFVLGITSFIYRYFFDETAIKCAIVAMSIFLVTFLWMGFFKNEDWIRTINMSNYRVSRLDRLNEIIKDKKILGSVLTYPLVRKNAQFYPLEKITAVYNMFPMDLEFDYILYPIQLAEAKSSLNSLHRMKQIKKLSFSGTYVWQGENYILYKVGY